MKWLTTYTGVCDSMNAAFQSSGLLIEDSVITAIGQLDAQATFNEIVEMRTPWSGSCFAGSLRLPEMRIFCA